MEKPLFTDLDAAKPGEPSGATTTPSAGRTYYPTLLIGLGGTGAEVLLRVKRLVQDRLPGRDSLHRFLFIDTDRATFSQKPGFPRIEQPEQCLVGVDKVQTLLDYPEMHESISERFPPEMLREKHVRNLANGMGAGQIRSLGALAFALDYATVRAALQSAFDELEQIAKRVSLAVADSGAAIGKNVVIYIVGSLNGGTGSGCLLDAALLARDVCRARDPKLVGVFALPNASFDKAVKQGQFQPARTRANAYAALKELQFVLDSDAPERDATIHYRYGGEADISLKPSDRLFQVVYLVDDNNELGQLSGLDDLFDLMARSIFQDVGSPFGAHRASFDCNNPVLHDDMLCPKTHRSRIFGTVATSSLVFPAGRVSAYCTFRELVEVLNDQLLGVVPSLTELEQAITAFLRQQELDERGSSDQILDSLLLDGTRNEVLAATNLGLPASWGRNLDHREFSAKIGQKWQEFTSADLLRVKSLVAANVERRLGRNIEPPKDRLAEAVQAFALSLAVGHNASSARRLLEELHRVLLHMRSELEGELNRWTTQDRRRFMEDFNQRSDQLAHLNKLVSWTTSKGNTLRTTLLNLFNDMVAQELGAAAKPLAIDLLDKLSHLVRAETDRWAALAEGLVALQREAKARYGRLETNVARPSSRFAVEQEVTRPGFELGYYVSRRIAPDKALALIAEKLGGREAMYRWMLDVPPVQRLAALGEGLGQPLYAAFAPDLHATTVDGFVASNPKEADGALDAKLTLAFQLCQPFWGGSPVEANMEFPEFLAVSVAHVRDKDGALVPPPVVEDWVRRFAPAGARDKYETIPTDLPYEITLGRRTFGARAFYLREAAEWRQKYDSMSANKDFMMATHSAFLNIPDLFPVDAGPITAFALGVALGFIATRGDSYYFALDRTEDVINVLYSTQAPTVTLISAASVPATMGELHFLGDSRAKLPKDRLLGVQREPATAALTDHPKWIAFLEEAVRKFQEAVGNQVFSTQLDQYVGGTLDQLSNGENVFAREAAGIRERLAAVGH